MHVFIMLLKREDLLVSDNDIITQIRGNLIKAFGQNQSVLLEVGEGLAYFNISLKDNLQKLEAAVMGTVLAFRERGDNSFFVFPDSVTKDTVIASLAAQVDLKKGFRYVLEDIHRLIFEATNIDGGLSALKVGNLRSDADAEDMFVVQYLSEMIDLAENCVRSREVYRRLQLRLSVAEGGTAEQSSSG